MSTTRSTRAAVAVTVAALTLAGASPAIADTDAVASAAPTSGGSLTVYQERAANLHPGAALNDINAAVYGDLFRLDEDGATYGLLADGIDATDPSNWTIHLREGVEFTDGTPLDAAAVQFNWEWHAVPENSSIAASTAVSIASMEVVDPLTLEVELAAPDSAFDIAVATGPLNWIGSPSAMEADIQAFGRGPVAAGPFMVSDFVQDGAITLERNPNYFESGLPYLDELIYQPVGEFEQRRNAVPSSGHAVGEYRTAIERDGYEQLGLSTVQAEANGGNALLLNTAVPPLDDVRVRQAIVQAVDIDALNEAVFNGLEEVAGGPFPEGSPYYDAEAAQLPYDPEAAQALIDEYTAEVGPIEFDITAIGGSDSLTAEWIAQQLNAYDNVNVGIESVDPTSRFSLMTSSDFDITNMNMIFHGATGSFFRNSLVTDGATNFTSYSNPEVDEHFAAASSALEVEERAEHVIEVQRILREEAPVLWTFRWARGWAATEDVGGLQVWGNSTLIPELVFVQSN